MKFLTAPAVLLLSAQIVSAQDEARYTVTGTNADGSPYSGEAMISASSNTDCVIAWSTGSTTSTGMCMRNGTGFAAAYELNGEIGLVVYELQLDGSMIGTWAIAGIPGAGTEVLTPK